MRCQIANEWGFSIRRGQTPVRADVRFVGGGGDRLGSSRDFDDGYLSEESEVFATFSLLEHS